MRIASDYPVTFPYGAKDGYWYGPNGKVGPYHKGNDRSTPAGTSIVISGVRIGATGATGTVSGAHLHTQAGTDIACQNTVNPTPYEFKPGTVVRLRTTDSGAWGKYVTVKVGNHYITYAHMSSVSTTVGTVIKPQGGDEMISDKDNEYWRWNKLGYQIRGRNFSREEFRKAAVGRSWLQAMEILSDDPEANRATEWQNVGKTALTDKWADQIYSLQDQVKALGSRPTKAELEAVKQNAADLAKQLEEAQKNKSEDTIILDEAGNWLTRLFNRLFRKETS